jgi:transcription elongation GreA/GreB family factor
MMHLEQEKLATKLREAIDQKAILDKINVSSVHNKVAVGSLVKTNKLTVYVATALPKLSIGEQNVFGISPQSPLGIQLLGNETNHAFQLNNVEYQILSIE